MQLANIATIPNFVSAKNLENLRRLMFLNNVRMAAQVSYFNIQKIDGKWYAFFYEEADTNSLSAKGDK